MKNRFYFLVLYFLILSSYLSFAQAGSLDLSFDTDGLLTTSIGTFDDEAKVIKIQPDGKIIVAGHSYNDSNYDFAVVRYNTNGSLDTTFGTNGVVTTTIGTSDEKARDLVIQIDGKIVVIGYARIGSNDAIAVVRYNSNGTLDDTFDFDGKVITSSGIYDEYSESIALQNDGKIVVTGTSYSNSGSDLIVVRYNTDGSLDASFNADGIATADVSMNNVDVGNSVVIQEDQKILVAGYCKGNLNADFAILRYNTDGSLDATFGQNGIKTHGIVGTFNEYATGMSIQNDGKIVVTGFTNNLFFDFIVTRYNTDGSFDDTFNNDGISTTDFGMGVDFGNAIDLAIQSDGKIVVVGYRNNGTPLNFALARYNSDGSLDATFDDDGLVITQFTQTGNCSGYDIAIQNDGKILVAGGSFDSQNSIALARYNNIINLSIDNNETRNIVVAPNPFSEYTVFHYSASFNNATLVVYNSIGQVVKKRSNIYGESITLNRDELTNGIYLVTLEQNQNTFFSTKLMVTE
jgi:uncharacterized delta-60 repeat protein